MATSRRTVRPSRSTMGTTTSRRSTQPGRVRLRSIFSLARRSLPLLVGIIISTVANPNNFANFTDSSGKYQMAVNYFETSGEGPFCAPLNISAANIDGVKDGSNVTVQFIFDGGDGALYQCADLTLSESLTSIPSSVSCSNATSNAGVTYFSAGVTPTLSATATSSGASSTSTSSAADAKAIVGVWGLLLSVFGGLLALA
ncbi:uncharacterized protein B0H18DRAFT_970832 [Fomitopsis serialis]|uniref:uncharacterized protein n=1 Tax=Fomitopsis serialis TaxID=139415 RepID=UPI0020080D9C|nr:uncharacterized protein B0H18DRAFT_970832 [Neoantrodia serialis]KAH9937482.1 hypothetical protein B0H18DRAFT_970832 [Neoantrodia serialis]